MTTVTVWPIVSSTETRAAVVPPSMSSLQASSGPPQVPS
jgi:hypothetical protein